MGRMLQTRLARSIPFDIFALLAKLMPKVARFFLNVKKKNLPLVHFRLHLGVHLTRPLKKIEFPRTDKESKASVSERRGLCEHYYLNDETANSMND